MLCNLQALPYILLSHYLDIILSEINAKREIILIEINFNVSMPFITVANNNFDCFIISLCPVDFMMPITDVT